MKKEDMRTRRTKKALRKAMIKLLEDNSIESISVTDICREAEINRVTFYTHYKDKYELLHEQLKELLAYIDHENKIYYEQHKTGDFIKDLTHTVSHSVYKTCINNKKIVRSLSKEEHSLFYKMIEDFIVNQGMKTLEYLNANQYCKFPPKFIIHFLIGGFSKLIFEFTLNDETTLYEHEFFLHFDKLFYSLLKNEIFVAKP